MLRGMYVSFALVIRVLDYYSTMEFISKGPFIHFGELIVELTDSEEALLADTDKYTLVGNFSQVDNKKGT